MMTVPSHTYSVGTQATVLGNLWDQKSVRSFGDWTSHLDLKSKLTLAGRHQCDLADTS